MTQTHPYITHWYSFCPLCKTELDQEQHSVHCSECDFAFYLNPAPCVTVVVHYEDKIVLAKRAIEPHKDLWNMPGGFVNPNETPAQTVHRELMEEISVEVEIVTQLGETMPDTYDKFLSPTLTFIYLVKPLSLDLVPQDDVAEVRWLDPSEIDFDTIAFENDKEAIRRYQKYIKGAL
jgi:NAD+ diphosphatase